LAAAKAWGLTPSEFWSLPAQERAYMIEFEKATAKMAQFEREEAKRKSKVAKMMAKMRSKLGL